MDSKELKERLDKGEIVVCPECDLFYPESETCEIVCCSNPFIGYSELDIEATIERTTKYFNESRETKIGDDKNDL